MTNSDPNPFIDALHFGDVGEALNINMNGLLAPQIPSPLTYYTYKGSLTTPDCSELVNWYVMETPLKVTSDQLALFTAKYAGNMAFAHGHGNNRNVQPLDHRVVRHGGVVCVEQLNYLYVFIGLYIFVNIIMVVMIKLIPKKVCKKMSLNEININSLQNLVIDIPKIVLR